MTPEDIIQAYQEDNQEDRDKSDPQWYEESFAFEEDSVSQRWQHQYEYSSKRHNDYLTLGKV